MLKSTNREKELRELLEQLNLGGMAAIFAETALRAAKEHLSHEAYLWELALHEHDLRIQRRTARLVRQSLLPAEKTFRTFDLSKLPSPLQVQIERLKGGTFLESATNVVAVGRPDVGKTHALAAVGYELVVRGYPVLWLPTSTLVQRLLATKRDLRLPQELAKLDKFACVILDDLGYIQQDRDEICFATQSLALHRPLVPLSGDQNAALPTPAVSAVNSTTREPEHSVTSMRQKSMSVQHTGSEPAAVPAMCPEAAMPDHSASKPGARSVDQKSRQILLRRVRSFWITGVLEQSLHGAALMTLGLQEQPDAVVPSWHLLLQHPDAAPRPLPTGTRMTQVYDDADGELLILGAPGSGKTTLLLELARDLLFRAEQDEDHPIPVVFNLSSWAMKRQTLSDWLVEELKWRARRIGGWGIDLSSPSDPSRTSLAQWLDSLEPSPFSR